MARAKRLAALRLSFLGPPLVTDMKKVLASIPKSRQTLFFSARRNPMSSIRSALSSTRYWRSVHLGERAPHVVEEASGAGHDHVHALAECALLPAHAHSAIHGGAGQRCAGGQFLEMFGYLRRKLPRRRQDERPGGAALHREQAVHDREEERGSLAAAGLGAGEQVTPLDAGIAACWMGVGCSKPMRRTEAWSSRESENSENVILIL